MCFGAFTTTYYGSTQGTREIQVSMITAFIAERIWKGNVTGGGEVCERQLFASVDINTHKVAKTLFKQNTAQVDGINTVSTPAFH